MDIFGEFPDHQIFRTFFGILYPGLAHIDNNFFNIIFMVDYSTDH